MKTAGIVGIVVILVALLGLQVMHFRTDWERQRQIDQICTVIPQVMETVIPSDQFKLCSYALVPHGEYGLYFANYNAREAILVRPGAKIQYYYVVGIPKGTLERWPRTLQLPDELSSGGRNKEGVKESKPEKKESKSEKKESKS
jgi:hypothetical protein